MSLTASLRDLKERQGAKLLRFGAVSAFNVILGQVLLYGAQTVVGMPPVTANVVTVAIGTIPAYLLSRYWVWQKRGRNHFWREVVPFWALTFAGFALSTLAVWFVAETWDPHPIFINLTNLTAFGVVWVVKFFVLDKVLFKDGPLTDEPLDALVDEIVHRRSDG